MHALMGTISGLIKTYIKANKPGLFVLQAAFDPNTPALFVRVSEGPHGQWYAITPMAVTDEEVKAMMSA